MASAKEELFRYVKDRYDKAFAARQMWQTRLQHLLLFCGFFVTAVLSFLGPTTFGILADCEAAPEFYAASVAAAAFFALLVYLAFPIHLLLTVLRRVDVYVAEADRDSFLARFRYEGEVNVDEQYATLATAYFDAIDDNTRFGAEVGRSVKRTVFHLRLLAILTFVIILLVGTIRVGVKSDWFLPSTKEQPRMSDQKAEPSGAATPSPAATPTAETAQPVAAPPPIKVISRPITANEVHPPTTITAVDTSRGDT